MPNPERLLTVMEFAEATGLHWRAVYRRIYAGKLRAYRVHGSSVRIPASSVEQLCREGGVIAEHTTRRKKEKAK